MSFYSGDNFQARQLYRQVLLRARVTTRYRIKPR